MLASTSLSFCSERVSALFAVCRSALESLKQHLDGGVLIAAALSARHEFRMVLLSAQLLDAFFLVPGVFLSSSLRARARWMRLLMTLTAVRAVLLSRTFFFGKRVILPRDGIAAARMFFCREKSPRDLNRTELRWNCCISRRYRLADFRLVELAWDNATIIQETQNRRSRRG